MAPKPKVEVAREHLRKAQEEAAAGDLKDAVQWSFASLEAAIDALAAKHGIAIEEQHWRRRDAAHELMLKGVLPGTFLTCISSSMRSARRCSMRARSPSLATFPS